MSDSQDETKVQSAVGEDGRPKQPGSAGQRSGSSSNGSTSAGGSTNGSSNGQRSSGPAKESGPNGSTASSNGGSGAGSQQRPASSTSSSTAGSAASGGSSTSSAASKSSTSGSPSSSGAASSTTTARPAPRSGQRTEGGRTLTAADYARTTRGGSDNTSVIPAIADDGSAASSSATPGRQARLRLNHVEPWSVTRLAFVISVAMMIVSVVAVLIFWVVLDVVGVWDQLNGSVTNVLADDSGDFDLTDYLGLGRLTGLTLLLSAINVIVFTALATIGAHLYNYAAQLLGGIQVTFSDD